MIVTQGAQFDPGHITQAGDPAVRIGLDDHLAELLILSQAAEGRHGILKNLAVGSRRLTDLSGGDLGILLFDGMHDVGRCQVAGRHTIGIEPDAHAVVALAHEGNIADTCEAREFVSQLNGRIVAEVEVVAGFIGRKQVDDHEYAGRLLFDCHAATFDEVGQDRLSEGHTVLHEHLGQIQVGA